MSSTTSGNKAVSTKEQTRLDDSEWEFERVAMEFRAGVSQEIEAKIDYSDERELADGRLFGQTQEAYERMRGREAEVERTRARTDRSQEPGREGSARYVTEVENEQRREVFARRRASVDPWADPEIADRADCSPNAAKKHLDRLAEMGIARAKKDSRPAAYERNEGYLGWQEASRMAESLSRGDHRPGRSTRSPTSGIRNTVRDDRPDDR
jgi:hypothetical protein